MSFNKYIPSLDSAVIFYDISIMGDILKILIYLILITPYDPYGIELPR